MLTGYVVAMNQSGDVVVGLSGDRDVPEAYAQALSAEHPQVTVGWTCTSWGGRTTHYRAGRAVDVQMERCGTESERSEMLMRRQRGE